MNRQIALRAFKNLCAFIGAIALFSYFVNWAADLRHWYFTLASALFCAILWFGFYVIETRGGVRQVVSGIAARLSSLRAGPELPSPPPETPDPVLADPFVTAREPAVASPVESPTVTKPNPLPWLRPRRMAKSDTAEKDPLAFRG